MANWIIDLDSIVFTRIKSNLTNELKTQYPDLFVTNSDRTPTEPKFPTVYIHPLNGVEVGATLEGNTINGVMYTLQIEVTVTKSQSQARNVMSTIINIMKKMMFAVMGTPEFVNTEETYRQIARFRRTIGANDKL